MTKEQKKILVIDDDAGMIKLLEKWLTVSGKEVVHAATGEDGFQKVKEEAPDLILLDLMLPGDGGVATAQKLIANESTKDIPIIFITAFIGVENDHGDETIDIDGKLYPVFAKPLHNAKLLSEIRKTINRRIHNNPDPNEGSS